MVLEVLAFKKLFMGKYYENLDTLIELIKKLDKKNLLAEFILDCIQISKNDPKLTPHEVIKQAKKKRLT
jgi:hypothetical protein